MVQSHDVSKRQACALVQVNRSSYEYVSVRKDDELVINELSQLVEKHPAIGFWMSYYRIRQKGFLWNYKRVYRIYTNMRLNISRRAKKRLPARVKQQLFQPANINQVWSIYFMHDSLWDRRTFRLFNVIDDYNSKYWQQKQILHYLC